MSFLIKTVAALGSRPEASVQERWPEMVMANPDWGQPYKNGWPLDLIVIVGGSCVGLLRPDNVPADMIREVDMGRIFDHLAECLAKWLFSELEPELWKRFSSQVLSGMTPAVSPESQLGRETIDRMKRSVLIYGRFSEDCLVTIADGLRPHLAEWAETELQDLIRAQLELPEANQARYAFRFPPDDIDIRVHFATQAGLHGSDDEPSVTITAGSTFDLRHRIVMSKVTELVFRLGDKEAILPEQE